MAITKSILIFALLMGWMVSSGGADEPSGSSAKGGVEAANKGNPFARGLSKRKASTDGKAETVAKEKNKQLSAGKDVKKEKVGKGQPTGKQITKTKTIQQQICTQGKRECQSGSIKECVCHNTDPETGEFTTCEWVSTGESCEDLKVDADEKMKESLEALESIGNTTQKGLDQAFGNMDKANKAIESLGKDERKSDWDTDFLIPME